MNRKYITLGFDKSGKAEILRQSSDGSQEHIVALDELKKSSHRDVVVVELDGRAILRSKYFEDGGTAPVNEPVAPTSIGRTGQMFKSQIGDITLHHQTPIRVGGLVGAQPGGESKNSVTDLPPNGDDAIETELNALKVDELKELAASEEVETTSDMKKADLVAAIAAKRRSASSEFSK